MWLVPSRGLATSISPVDSLYKDGVNGEARIARLEACTAHCPQCLSEPVVSQQRGEASGRSRQRGGSSLLIRKVITLEPPLAGTFLGSLNPCGMKSYQQPSEVYIMIVMLSMWKPILKDAKRELLSKTSSPGRSSGCWGRQKAESTDYTPATPATPAHHTIHANQMPRTGLLSGRQKAAGASFIRSNSGAFS